MIEENSALIDVGCGTGRLAFQIADKCSRIDAIDLSIKNINLAKNKLSITPLTDVSFYHSDITRFLNEHRAKYDYAILSYVIHEVDEELRTEILTALSNAAKKIIVIDYLTPRSKGFWGVINEMVEFAAGRDHYKNFKSYVSNGGIYGLAQLSGLKIVNEIKNIPSTSHIVILSKQTF
ncbi:MAG: class I SAM-dependent methyltransferase [Melioribacteraceae bacterium]|nr:class I SAM-dependent methyltransferase [Melioribacteraceae bacterium]